MSTLLHNPLAALTTRTGGPLHVAWVNQHAATVGGAEHYILRTVRELNKLGVRNSLLYEVDGATSHEFLSEFESAFPLVEPRQQLNSLNSDIAYVHRLSDEQLASELHTADAACLRFYHDHALFCLREHKYTAIGRQTCTRSTGLNCYACLGFVQRTARWPGIGFQSLGDLERRQDNNRHWDAHVVGSQYMAEHLALHGFDEARIHVAPLFVPHEVSEANSIESQRDSRLLAFGGQMVNGKGVDLLLRAITRLPKDVRLEIAGDGRQRSKLQELAGALGVKDRVAFLGKLDADSLQQLFRRAAVVAMPSRAPETFGLSGLEANAVGAPVVACDVGGIGQWLRHEENGLLVPPNDWQALAESLGRLFDDARLRSRLGAAGVERGRHEFSFDRHLHRLSKLFRVCLQGELT